MKQNNIKLTTVSLYFLLIVLSACSQGQPKNGNFFSIDKSLEKEVESKLSSYSRKSNACMEIEIEPDSVPFTANAQKGQPGLSFTTFSNSTAGIECLNGIDNGIGFSMIVSKDTTIIKCKVLSNDPDLLFNFQPNDALQPELLIPIKSGKVTFANLPKFKKQEVIKGKVELESQPYYEHSSGNVRKLKVKLVSYIQSEPLPIVDGKYKTLQK